ncbi:hypothetical protein [Sphingomonas sp. Marseille-Q8236]
MTHTTTPPTNAERWLATYVDKHGKLRAAVITAPEGKAVLKGWPTFGLIDEETLGLDDFDGEPVTLSSLPNDEDFRPVIIDIDLIREVPLQFIDL